MFSNMEPSRSDCEATSLVLPAVDASGTKYRASFEEIQQRTRTNGVLDLR
jgi:hypothetical protein